MSKLQLRIRVTGIIFGSIPLLGLIVMNLTTRKSNWDPNNHGLIKAIHESAGFIGYYSFLLLLPIGIALGCIDLGMSLANRKAKRAE